MGELTAQDLFPFPERSCRRTWKVRPIEGGKENVTYSKVAGGGKGPKSCEMELFAIVGAELGEGGNLHILTYGVKYFYFRCCPGR